MGPAIWLAVRAPFAAFRGFQGGAYRSTMPVMPPSAAHGFVLNLAGIETRGDSSGVTTQMRDDVPPLQIAVGVRCFPNVATVFQQLHSYPVGPSGKALQQRTHGSKYWIAPVRRELLVDYHAVIGIQGHRFDLAERIRKGIRGELKEARYGLPFAGDNNLMIDRIDLLDSAPPSYWYERLEAGGPVRRGSCRLTAAIDRSDSSRSLSFVYAPTSEAISVPPEAAWTWTPRNPD